MPWRINWLDPAGFTKDAIYGRWYECDSAPTPTITRVPLAQLRQHLPADIPSVTREHLDLLFAVYADAVIPAPASYKCASLQFAVGYSMKEFLYIADQMDKGHCDPKAIITNDICLDALPAMMETLRGPNEETTPELFQRLLARIDSCSRLSCRY